MPKKVDAEIALHEFSVRYRAGLAKRYELSRELLKGVRDTVRDQYQQERAKEGPSIEAPKIEAPAIEAPAIEEPKIDGPKIEGPKIEPPQHFKQRQIEGPEPDI